MTTANVRRWAALVVVAVAVLWGAGAGEATTFTYVKIADFDTAVPGGNGGPFTTIGEPVLVNGTAYFAGAGGGRSGIYSRVVDGGPLVVRYDSTTPVPGGDGTVGFSSFFAPIASPGGIAFMGVPQGSPPGVSNLYSDVGGTLHVVAERGAPIPGSSNTFTSFGFPWTWSGVVAFRARGTNGHEGVYAFANGVLRRVADTSMTVPGSTGTFVRFGRATGVTFGGIPATHGGAVVFFGAGSNGEFGIYKEVNGTFSVVADHTTAIPGGTGTFTVLDWSDMAADIHDGVVVFVGAGANGQLGFYAHDGTALSVLLDRTTPVHDIGGTVSGFGGQGFGYDKGHLSFLANEGIFTTLGGVLRRVIVNNTIIDGQNAHTFGTYGRGIDGNLVNFHVSSYGGTARNAIFVAVASNEAPVATPDALSVAENGIAAINVVGNDSDPDGDQIFVAGFTNGAHGTVACNDTICSYRHTAATFTGSDTFTYTVSDGRGGTAAGTVSVTVVPVDDADLSVALTPSANPVGRGRALSYTIVLGNAGPETARTATASFPIPAGTSFVSATTTQGTLRTPNAGATTGTVAATLGAIARGATATVTVTVNVPSTAPAQITAFASVAHGGRDPGSTNNTAKVTVPVVTVGTFVLTPKHVTAVAETHVRFALEWTIPGPSWRELKDLELRVRDDRDVILHVKLTEGVPMLLALRDPKTGRFGPGAAPGTNTVLESRTARVFMAGTTVTADGPTDPSVVLTLDVEFDRKTAGERYVVEVKARDDLGNAQDWKRAGTVTVTKPKGGPPRGR